MDRFKKIIEDQDYKKVIELESEDTHIKNLYLLKDNTIIIATWCHHSVRFNMVIDCNGNEITK